MTRTYSLLIEGEEGAYSAYVPELPAILVTGKSIEELMHRAKETIGIWWETAATEASPVALRREIEVELPS